MLSKLILGLLLIPSVWAQAPDCPPEAPFSELSEILKGTKDECDELPKGQFRKLSKGWGGAEKLLERDGNGNYRLTLHLSFKPQSQAKVTSEEMHKRVAGCLREVSPYLKGPEGQTLQVRILNRNENEALPKDQRIKARQISIQPRGTRSNSLAYEESANCGTFTHEVLHLLGLRDEYRETSAELSPSMNCRAVTHDESIMANHIRAFQLSLPQKHVCQCMGRICGSLNARPELMKKWLEEPTYPMTGPELRSFCRAEASTVISGNPISGLALLSNQGDEFRARYHELRPSFMDPGRDYSIQETRIVCRCQGDQECLKRKNEIQTFNRSAVPLSDDCPQGTIRNFSEESKEAGTKINDKNLYFSTPARRPSLLYPNHFRRIVSGSCKGAVPQYEQCAEFAYKGDRGGKSVCQTPEECKHPEYYIGSFSQ